MNSFLRLPNSAIHFVRMVSFCSVNQSRTAPPHSTTVNPFRSIGVIIGFFISPLSYCAKPNHIRVNGEGYRHSGVNAVGQHRIHDVALTACQVIGPILNEVGCFLFIKSVIRKNPAEYFIPFVCRNKETLFGLKCLPTDQVFSYDGKAP